jgi:integrase/recombinase XerD
MPKNESITDLIAAYEKWIALQGFSEDSATDHRQKLNRFWSFLDDRGLIEAGRPDLGGIDRELIADYQAHLFEVVSEVTGKRLSTASQINYLSYLQNFYRFLKTTGRVSFNPTDIIKLPRQPQVLPHVLLTPPEVRRLLSVPDLSNPLGYRDRVMLEVFWSTGIRLGEAVKLHTADVDLDQGLLTLKAPKGRKDRAVPVGEGAIGWLENYINDVRPVILKQSKADEKNSLWLFLSRFGRKMDRSGVFYKLQSYARRAKLKKKIGTHTFRHTLASEMLRAGADLRHIQEMLGHDNLATTQRYLHIVKAELKKVHGKTHPREAATAAAAPRYRSCTR